MGPEMYLFFCCFFKIVLRVSPDVVDIGVFCCLFVVCIYIYMFGWLCRATYYLLYLRCLVYHMLSKTRRSHMSLQSESVYMLYLF